MKTRLGIVGAGLIFHLEHKERLKKLDHLFEITGFAVKTDRTRASLLKEFPGAHVFKNYAELVKRDDVDAVVVLTPICLNAAVAMAALKAGKHVLVEKPLATTLREVRRIMRLELTRDRRVMVLEQVRYDRKLETLKSTLAEGKIGHLVSYELVNHWQIDDKNHTARGYGTTEWRINPAFPLGSIFDAGIHTIAKLSYLFSPAESAYALASNLRPGYGKYDHILMSFSHPGGVSGTLSLADCLDDSNNYFLVRGSKGTLRFETDRLHISGHRNETVSLPESDMNLNMWQQCAAWFENRDTPVYGSKEALSDIATLLAVERSIRKRRRIKLRQTLELTRTDQSSSAQ